MSADPDIPSPTGRQKLTRQAMTLALSAVGAGLFHWLGLPLPFLFGPMCFCLIAALTGTPLAGMGQVSVGARTILGLAVGASITPAVLHQLPQMAASVVFVPVFILLIGLIGVPFFTRVCGFDRATAYYAAMPGGLPDMVLFGEEAGADVRALALIHTTRVLIIITVAPILLVNMFGVTLSNPIGAPARDVPVAQLLLMLAAAWIGWKGGARIGLFGASIIGPLIVSALLSLLGILQVRPPAEALNVAQFFIGSALGVGYVGVTLHEIRKDVLAGIAFSVILALLAFTMMEIVVLAGFAQPIEGFLSFTPGGQAEMTVLAIVAGADLGFIVVHHLVRLMVVIAGAPVMAHFLGLRARKKI